MELRDKVAVVTGASSGLGRAFAIALVQKGAHVYGLARRVERLNALRDELGLRFHPIACDVTRPNDVEAAFRRVIREAGRLDILINNAGLGKMGPVDELSLEDWDVQMNTNLRGVFLCTRAAVPQMKKQNAETGFGGHIINIASVAGLIGNPNLSAYNATKFGVRGFSEAIMKELRDHGIKVTCVYPGSVATEFFEVSGMRRADRPVTPEQVAQTILHILETDDNYLISEVVIRPLRPR
ncbi:3-oxoacyl-(acyl-carrier-protein) reductase [Rhodothermus marinus SG0.5JP17-172]|uniref:SDR family oxidoreductase n=1 Tax=Rhodothermus marinus TaxID=29549 RepID=UPI000223DE8C|nr:SDR family NAD(P)-dependent oxidoreductase [Rhodothermus marinus]AEN74543.1 3-oxoacyl-(acyl-carrier-protein) reductase [Rhodothermus marinus SG0.5JP17-172]MBO2491870.1 SDR family NAD(P)-dependent oxidoreductase [Rhodothermus marinus]